MPIYNYKCKKCELEFEDIKNIEERTNGKCPNCNNEEDLQILPSTFNFTIKIK